MFAFQIFNHRGHLAVVVAALVWNGGEVKLFRLRFETSIILADKVGASVVVNGYLPLVLAVSLTTHRVESVLGRGAVVWRLLSHGEVSFCQLVPLGFHGSFIDRLNIAEAFMDNRVISLETHLSLFW